MSDKQAAIPGKVLSTLISNPTARSILGRAAIGGGVGGGMGYFVTPHMFGYEDVPKARRVSAYGDALTGAVLGALTGYPAGRQWLGGMLKSPGRALGMASAPVIAEAPPLMAAKVIREREAAESTSEAAKQISEAASSMSIPNALRSALNSNTARGAAGGAAVAGLAALLTGLMRRRSRNEIQDNRNRIGMVKSDFLKYLLPALVAGGLVGSFRDTSRTRH